MRRTTLLLAAVACRQGFDPIARNADAPVVITDAVTDAVADAPADAAVTVVEFRIYCATGPRSAAQVCSDAGYSQVVVAHAYHWFECAGALECPTGWAADGISCADWCGAADCAAMQYCGTGRVVTERVGGASLTLDPAEFYDCVNFNPGWLMRAQCSN